MDSRQTARHLLAAVLSVSVFGPCLLAQQDRITEPVDSGRVLLTGQIHPKIRTATDAGPVDASLPLPYVTLILKPSASQQAELDQLLAEQQDSASANYHRWLTPEQFADRFGASQHDIDALKAWLAQQHLTLLRTARGRNAISFSGTAGLVERAFATEIHHYQVDGAVHFANATEPSIPAAFGGVISAIRGLNDFRLRSRVRQSARPRYTTSQGGHELGPGDLATIYDIASLHAAGINGTGQNVVVAGQTELVLSDLAQYRSFFNFTASNPTALLVPGTRNPGLSVGDLLEADLDLELMEALVPKANVTFIYSYDVFDAVQYAVDQNLAPVLSVSYGQCEQQTSMADAQSLRSWAQQGNAQGISWFSASGDDGAADCYGGDDPSTNNAESVDLPAAIPEVTGVGGTEFVESGASDWSAKNNSDNASALSYIPETAWNDSAEEDQPSATGGGASMLYTKPTWQAGLGVPADNARDVPDVAFAASPIHDAFLEYSHGSFTTVGGTSAGAPSFAGIAVMLNQYLIAHGFQSKAGLGNLNPKLYSLGQAAGVFHDITTGNNEVNPCLGVRDCIGSTFGFKAGPGYDQTTGWGTPDVNNLIQAWASSLAPKAAVTLAVSTSASSVTFAGSVVLTATVTSANAGTPTGTVDFTAGSVSLGSAALVAGSGGSAAATLTLYGILLNPGANTITAAYSGDSVYESATATVSVAAPSMTSTAAPTIGGVANGASFTQTFAPGGIVSVFGTNLSPGTGGAPVLPLPNAMAGVTATINGVAAPFYYASPDQLNLQIPYDAIPGFTSVLVVHNNGQTATFSFPMDAAAPGIFTFDNGAPVPYTTAKRGDIITLYLTGQGAVTPAIATGAAPSLSTPLSDLPAPTGGTVVTVGNVKCNLQFAGIPYYLVGVMQINYQIPANAPLGPQPVVVTIGGVESAATTLTVTD